MSYSTFFSFSQGLSKALRVPKGTFAAIVAHVEKVEATLGLVAEKYRDNHAHWRSTTPKGGVTDKVFCETASDHNRWVRGLYENLAKWSKALLKGKDSELLTPAQAQKFWHGLQEIRVPARRWTEDYCFNNCRALWAARYLQGFTPSASHPVRRLGSLFEAAFADRLR